MPSKNGVVLVGGVEVRLSRANQTSKDVVNGGKVLSPATDEPMPMIPGFGEPAKVRDISANEMLVALRKKGGPRP